MFYLFSCCHTSEAFPESSTQKRAHSRWIRFTLLCPPLSLERALTFQSSATQIVFAPHCLLFPNWWRKRAERLISKTTSKLKERWILSLDRGSASIHNQGSQRKSSFFKIQNWKVMQRSEKGIYLKHLSCLSWLKGTLIRWFFTHWHFDQSIKREDMDCPLRHRFARSHFKYVPIFLSAVKNIFIACTMIHQWHQSSIITFIIM